MSSPSFEEFLLDFLLDFNEDFSCFGRNIKQNRGKTQSSSWKVVMVCWEGLVGEGLCLFAHKQVSRRLEPHLPALGVEGPLTSDSWGGNWQARWMDVGREGKLGQGKGKRGMSASDRLRGGRVGFQLMSVVRPGPTIHARSRGLPGCRGRGRNAHSGGSRQTLNQQRDSSELLKPQEWAGSLHPEGPVLPASAMGSAPAPGKVQIFRFSS